MKMRSIEIDSLAVDTISNDIVVILKARDEGDILPIWIGNAEAISIALALAGIKPQRPLTHDLIAKIFHGLKIKLLKIVITALVDNTYYALLYLQSGDELVVVDARPSDSIAIAVRTNAPMFMSDEVPTISADKSDEDRQKLEKRVRRLDPKKFLGER